MTTTDGGGGGGGGGDGGLGEGGLSASGEGQRAGWIQLPRHSASPSVSPFFTTDNASSTKLDGRPVSANGTNGGG